MLGLKIDSFNFVHVIHVAFSKRIQIRSLKTVSFLYLFTEPPFLGDLNSLKFATIEFSKKKKKKERPVNCVTMFGYCAIV